MIFVICMHILLNQRLFCLCSHCFHPLSYQINYTLLLLKIFFFCFDKIKTEKCLLLLQKMSSLLSSFGAVRGMARRAINSTKISSSVNPNPNQRLTVYKTEDWTPPPDMQEIFTTQVGFFLYHSTGLRLLY